MCNLEFSSLSSALTTTLFFNVYHLHWHSLDLQPQKPFSLILFGMTGGGGSLQIHSIDVVKYFKSVVSCVAGKE